MWQAGLNQVREKNLVEMSFLEHSFIQQIHKVHGEKRAQERLRELNLPEISLFGAIQTHIWGHRGLAGEEKNLSTD